jgi:hypothetical protein
MLYMLAWHGALKCLQSSHPPNDWKHYQHSNWWYPKNEFGAWELESYKFKREVSLHWMHHIFSPGTPQVSVPLEMALIELHSQHKSSRPDAEQLGWLVKVHLMYDLDVAQFARRLEACELLPASCFQAAWLRLWHLSKEYFSLGNRHMH